MKWRSVRSVLPGPEVTLFVSQDGIADVIGQTQVLGLVRAIARRYSGWMVLLTLEKPPFYGSESAIRLRQKLLQERIVWISFPFSWSPGWKRLFREIWELLILGWMAILLVIRWRVARVHVRALPSALAVIPWLRWRCPHIPVLYDMRNFFAEQRALSGQWNPGKFSGAIRYYPALWLEKYCVRKASHVVVLTWKARRYLLRTGLRKHPHEITVLPSVANSETIPLRGSPTARDIRRRIFTRYFPGYDFEGGSVLLGYLGSIHNAYDWDWTFLFFREFLEKVSRGFLFLALWGKPLVELREWVFGQIGRPEWKSRVAVVQGNPGEITRMISALDVSCFFLRRGLGNWGSSPVKMAESFLAGVPVISREEADVGRWIRRFQRGLGLMSSQAGKEEMIRILTRDLPELLRHISPRALRECATNWFASESVASAYRWVYRRMMESSAGLFDSI